MTGHGTGMFPLAELRMLVFFEMDRIFIDRQHKESKLTSYSCGKTLIHAVRRTIHLAYSRLARP
jgi:NADH:ubiquinone oxidoreductase subunit 3 (subunit A)